jgi:hypothetical protein
MLSYNGGSEECYHTMEGDVIRIETHLWTSAASPLNLISENISTARFFISSMDWGPTNDSAWSRKSR